MRSFEFPARVISGREPITATELREELKSFLTNKVVIMDCGHRFCLHPFSNTLIMYCDGTMICHNCGY